MFCSANQWTGFYMITASVVKGLNVLQTGYFRYSLDEKSSKFSIPKMKLNRITVIELIPVFMSKVYYKMFRGFGENESFLKILSIFPKNFTY